MAIRWFPFSVSTLENKTQGIQNNEMKTQRWILGVIIGSAPFLIIVICWVFVSVCTNTFIQYYQYLKKRRRHIQKKPVADDAVQMVAI
jgi:hypothetical protein